MQSKTRFARLGLIAAGALFVLSLAGACSGPYQAWQGDGKCSHGRTWQPAQKDASGKWVDGKCVYAQ